MHGARGWQAIFAPAGTPKPIVQKLNTSIVGVLKMPDVQERLAGLGMDTVAGTPDELGQFQKAEVVKWSKIVKEANIKPE